MFGSSVLVCSTYPGGDWPFFFFFGSGPRPGGRVSQQGPEGHHTGAKDLPTKAIDFEQYESPEWPTSRVGPVK